MKPRYKRIRKDKNGKKYELLRGFTYYSLTFGKFVNVPKGYRSDGATGARDLKNSLSWWIHDKLCDDACWSDGTPLDNLDASQVLHDILEEEGRNIRKYTWKWMTFLLGGWKIKRRVGWA